MKLTSSDYQFLVRNKFDKHMYSFAIDQTLGIIIKLSIYQGSLPRHGNFFHMLILATYSVETT